MRIGFIGTGVISEAMIRGLCDVANYKDPIIVSQRSDERSEALAKQYANVEVSTHNQDVVDRSDWVFIGVLPEQVPSVLDTLNFREDQRIVSLAAGALSGHSDAAHRVRNGAYCPLPKKRSPRNLL
ncbi:MAG: hypothetical protein EBY36_09190 [Gammaproteobacteria bacterium]|nr:hypothetical protein [Gammaproteobacteria bacterium]